MRMILAGLVTAFMAATARAQDRIDLSTRYENLARGKPYVLHPMPNYEYTRNDTHALTRLTDGEYTDVAKGQYWVQPTTVGWAEPVAEMNHPQSPPEFRLGVSWEPRG